MKNGGIHWGMLGAHHPIGFGSPIFGSIFPILTHYFRKSFLHILWRMSGHIWHTVARHWSKGCIPYLTIAFSRRPPSVCLSITQQTGVRMSMGKSVIVSDCYNIKVPRLAPVKFTHKRPFKSSQMAFLAVDKRLFTLLCQSIGPCVSLSVCCLLVVHNFLWILTCFFITVPPQLSATVVRIRPCF